MLGLESGFIMCTWFSIHSKNEDSGASKRDMDTPTNRLKTSSRRVVSSGINDVVVTSRDKPAEIKIPENWPPKWQEVERADPRFNRTLYNHSIGGGALDNYSVRPHFSKNEAAPFLIVGGSDGSGTRGTSLKLVVVWCGVVDKDETARVVASE